MERGPGLIYRQTLANNDIVEKCPAMRTKYHPPWYLFNGHVHSMVAVKGSPYPKLNYEREELVLPDGGIVSLDWVGKPHKYKPDHPTILILHGAGGSSRDTYVRVTAQALVNTGWRVVAMNLRGHGSTPLATPLFGNRFSTTDIRAVVAHLRKTRVPLAPLIGIGFSSGANLMVKYAGQDGASCLLTAVVSISNTYDMVAADKVLHNSLWSRRVYSGGLVDAMKRHFFKHPQNATLFDAIPSVDVPKLAAATTVRDFEDVLDRRLEGYATLEAYYHDGSCIAYMADVRIPVLCVSALDDPICTPEMIPDALCLRNPSFILVKTLSGGHLGFLEGNGSAMWTSHIISQYCTAISNGVMKSGVFLSSL
ncbi:Aste57867_1960 [Aphanomyces stellatus]|uniref:Aste57867_1960 protein n=1 Tax=Aphanomyces stellatus TaxID=120398 RepID=A0A485KA15_9STRA|nr:hypothetical protein As57867_001958 [Aphanomyces stellatus]VFT79165.1 Aste57867_1960 [Aphanomyces stellatus]